MKLETSDHPELSSTEIDEAHYPSLRGKGVLITGGGSGIGMYLVEAFCRQGARVAFLDINDAAGRRVADVCASNTGNRPHFAQVDLTDIAGTQTLIAQLIADHGPFSALVNNAGNDDRLPADEVTPEYWDSRMNVNLRHQFFVAQAVARGMDRGGAIVNMGSTSWMQGAPGLIAYTTAKSAIVGLTKSLAREWGGRMIRVNSIAPGWILTERQVSRAKAIYPDKFAQYLDRQCLKEFLLPPDVARMALWLAADDSRMVTGQTFIVDGGVV